MNKKLKILLSVALFLASALIMTSCFSEPSQYEKYDSQGYTVSVKYDANGGSFGTNTSSVRDTYNPSSLTVGENGMAELTLLPPDSQVRSNPSTVKNSGYFLAGWYTEREPVLDADGNHLDYFGAVASESGKTPAYTYSGRWNFDTDKYEIDPSGSYTSAEPVLTLYAAWVPEFSFEFYSIDGTLIDTLSINPLINRELVLPEWREGKMENNDFPKNVGKTFSAAYIGAKDGEKIESTTILHSGTFDPDDASYTNNVNKIFVEYLEGEWYNISTPEQLRRNANASAHYVINADLDFEGTAWPITGTFRGSIIGNGHTISNVKVSQSSTSNNGGIFAKVVAGAKIENVCFENATYELLRGTSISGNGATFGLFAGTVEEGADINGVTLTGQLIISPDAYFPANYSIGLVCGLGYEHTGIDYSGITVSALEVSSSLYVIEITSISANEVYIAKQPKSAN